MDVLLLVTALLVLFVLSTGSMLRSCFIRGRHRGMQEAAGEIIRGIESHFEANNGLPAEVAKAIEALHAPLGDFSHSKQLNLRHARLWVFGDAIGRACWRGGYRAGKLAKSAREGRILVELEPSQLLQLTWLAHLGFQHMMPNYRGFETHRFDGEDDARDGTRAIERLEASIPASCRPADPIALSNSRLALIEKWWNERKLAAV
jgi:hypothetical protein